MQVIIIGNGVAGIAAALELRRQLPSAGITVISEESKQHYSRPALMYLFNGALTFKEAMPFAESFFKKKQIISLKSRVQYINRQTRTIQLQSQETLSYDKLVMATGARGSLHGWPGETLQGVQCFTNLQELEQLKKQVNYLRMGQKAVIVGGGLIGIEVAEILSQRKIPVVFLVRESSYFKNALSASEGAIVEEEIQSHGIDLRMNTALKSIGSHDGVHADSVETSTQDIIPSSLIILTAGVTPEISLAEQAKLKTNRGIVVNRHMQTSDEHIFACGDVAEIIDTEDQKKGKVEQLWYTGKMQGQIAGYNCYAASTEKAMKQYDRGVWYNSARFFEIDFHTYGDFSQADEELFFKKNDEKKTLRLGFKNRKLIAVNSLGMRLRHNVIENMILTSFTQKQVLDEIHRAAFDPEFSDTAMWLAGLAHEKTRKTGVTP